MTLEKSEDFVNVPNEVDVDSATSQVKKGKVNNGLGRQTSHNFFFANNCL